MSFLRMLAVGGIFLVACGGWALLGTTTLMRAHNYSSHLEEDVRKLWGTEVVQEAPELTLKVPGREEVSHIQPSANRVDVALDLDYRQRGLIWYPTFACQFKGTYRIDNDAPVGRAVRLHFKFPSPSGTYDNFVFEVDGAPRNAAADPVQGVNEIVEVPAGGHREFTVGYRTRGLGLWRYRPAAGTGGVRGLDLNVTTNFRQVDYPDGSLSPTTAAAPRAKGEGMTIAWNMGNVLTSQDIGVVMPERINPGPLSARMTYFAPVCLLFFFVLIAAINIVCRVSIHPMHYLFVAAGFFAFHLLFAYLVDHLPVHAAFAIAAVAAVVMVTGYLALALGRTFPWTVAAAGQIFYLVLFSYSFFLKGMTGLTVTVGAVLTLAALMWVTAKIDWFAFFGKPKAAAAGEGCVTG
jgi:hypothetical protein